MKAPTSAVTIKRAGEPNEEIHFGVGRSSLGPVVVASSEKGVVSILIGEDPAQLVFDLQQRFPKAHVVRADRDSVRLVKSVIDFIEAPAQGLDLPLDLRGTAFQKRVWKVLQEIPAGETTTFTEVARKIGAPKAIRAVGNACATNNIAVAIPCHRVLHKDGSLSGGYHWGSDRQRALISREAAAGARGRSISAVPR